MSEPPAILDYGARSDPERRRRRWRLFRRLLLVAAVLLVGVVVFVALQINGFVKRQRAAMETARQHIPLIRAHTDGDSRFSNVLYAPFTAQNGSLLISGEVPNQQALTSLQQVVAGTSPPVPVVWSVDIVPLLTGPTTVPTTTPAGGTRPPPP
jgi:hypothetical protein